MDRQADYIVATPAAAAATRERIDELNSVVGRKYVHVRLTINFALMMIAFNALVFVPVAWVRLIALVLLIFTTVWFLHHDLPYLVILLRCPHIPRLPETAELIELDIMWRAVAEALGDTGAGRITDEARCVRVAGFITMPAEQALPLIRQQRAVLQARR